MIRTLAARPAQRRILIAGEMLELGEQGRRNSTLPAARLAADAGLDIVVGAVRGNAQLPGCCRPAGAAWLPSSSPMPRPPGSGSPPTCAKAMWVLVKGSRGVHLERALEVLKNNAAETQ